MSPDTEDQIPGEVRHASAEEEEHTPARLIGSFFLVPFLIIVGCVAVFLLFGVLSSEGKTASDYLEEVRSGHFNRRWQAAFELSRHLALNPEAREDEELAGAMVRTLQESDDSDPRIRAFLIAGLGSLQNSRAIPALVASLDDPDPQVRFNAVVALGDIGDTSAVPALIRVLDSEDKGLRVAAAAVLGGLGDERAVPRLEKALHDSQEDLRWNAAFALSRLGRLSAVDQLTRMLDREHLASVTGATPAQQEQALVEAIRSLARLEAREARPALEELAEGDPSPDVRQAAAKALLVL